MPLPDYTTQSPSVYKANIDAKIAELDSAIPTTKLGFVNSSGNITNSNGGVTVSKQATGVYRLTHNFGTGNNIVNVTPASSSTKIFHVQITNDYADVKFFNNSSVPADGSFSYSAVKY